MDLGAPRKVFVRGVQERLQTPQCAFPHQRRRSRFSNTGSGHDVRFSVSNDDLMGAMASRIIGRSCGDNAAPTRRLERLYPHFSKYGWPFSHDDKEDLEKYNGPPAPNGAGFTVWYSRNNGIAYFLHRSFWVNFSSPISPAVIDSLMTHSHCPTPACGSLSTAL